MLLKWTLSSMKEILLVSVSVVKAELMWSGRGLDGVGGAL